MTTTRLFIPLLALTLTLAACNGDAPDTDSADLSGDAQVIEVDVNADGYVPDSIPLEEGVPTELIFTRHTDNSCVERVEIPAFDLEAELPEGEPVSVELIPDRTGEFSFTCGMDMVEGTLVVES